MNEYPAISIDEQMMLKGGLALGPIIIWALTTLGGVAAATIYDVVKNHYGEKEGLNIDDTIGKLTQLNCDSLRVDSNTNHGIYNLSIYGSN